MNLRVAPWLLLAGLALATSCGEPAKAPIEVGFTGTCKLDIHRDVTSYIHTFPSPDELKTHVTLHVVKDTLVAIRVEIPDNRTSSGLTALPDNPLLVGEAKPNVLLDRAGDVDVPVQTHIEDARGEAREPWDLEVRVRFRDDSAEAVAGRMVVRGPCVAKKPTP